MSRAELTLDVATDMVAGISCHRELSSALDVLVGEQTTVGELQTISLAISRTGILVPVIKSVLSDQEYMQTVRSRSYQFCDMHDPKGPASEFIHIGLATGTDGGGLTDSSREANIHIWHPDFRATDITHKHSRLIGSVILSDKVLHRIYVEVSDDEAAALDSERLVRASMYRGQVPTKAGFAGKVWLEDQGVQTVSQGETHGIYPDFIHKITLGPTLESPVITLNTRGPRLTNGWSFLPDGEEPKEPSPIQMMQVPVERYLEEVVDILENQ